MEQYKLEVRIKSCVVGKKLIKEIESYFKDRLPKKLKSTLSVNGDFKDKYKLILKDDLGEEHLASIDDYYKDKLPNDIREVSLDYEVNYPIVDIRVRFSKDAIFTYMNIGLQSEGAKELAVGIKSEIERLLLENATINYIFYNKYSWIILVAIMVASNFLARIEFPYSGQLSLFFIFSGVAYYLIRLVSPYTDFETNRKEKRDKFISWFLNGMAGVIVFGVIAFHLREKLL